MLFYFKNHFQIIFIFNNFQCVVKLDLIGLDFLWLLVLECLDESLAEAAMKLLLDMSFVCLSSKLKRDPPQLHQRFINECHRKLDRSYYRLNETAVGSAVSTATKTLTAMAVSDITSHTCLTRTSCLQHLRRVLQLAEYYISIVEENYQGKRSFPPHAATFTGKPIVLHVIGDNNKLELNLHVSTVGPRNFTLIHSYIQSCSGFESTFPIKNDVYTINFF